MLQEQKDLSVPWSGLDILLFFALWLAIPYGVCAVATGHFEVPHQPQEQRVETEKKDYGHPILQLVKHGKNKPAVLLLAFLAVVIAAPLIEEFLFRLLLQGWIEAKFGSSSIAIIAVSLCFAVIHSGNNTSLDEQMLYFSLAVLTVANLSIFVSGIIYLDRIRNLKMFHSVFGTDRFFHLQFFKYAGYCLLALLFVFGIAAALKINFPNTNTDPIPIFFFSLVLGFLYSKTRNLSYCILLHACLNLTSLTFAWLAAWA